MGGGSPEGWPGGGEHEDVGDRGGGGWIGLGEAGEVDGLRVEKKLHERARACVLERASCDRVKQTACSVAKPHGKSASGAGPTR